MMLRRSRALLCTLLRRHLQQQVFKRTASFSAMTVLSSSWARYPGLALHGGGAPRPGGVSSQGGCPR